MVDDSAEILYALPFQISFGGVTKFMATNGSFASTATFGVGLQKRKNGKLRLCFNN